MDEIENTPQPESESELEVQPKLEVDTTPLPVDSPAAPVRVIRRVARPRPVDNTVPTEFLWLMLPIVFLLGLGTGWLLWAGSKPAAVADSGAATRYEVAEAGNPAVGPVNAPVTIIEFSDYQCPYCKSWYDTVKTRLLTDYEGRIRFVYRDLPLVSIHPEAQGAAEAADCAGEQNAYWAYHDALFGRKFGLGAQAYPQYATELGLDVTAFNVCVVERRYKNEVDADLNFGLSLGLNGTPTFFVNGLKLVGAQPYEVFKQVIDNELASAAESKQKP